MVTMKAATLCNIAIGLRPRPRSWKLRANVEARGAEHQAAEVSTKAETVVGVRATQTRSRELQCHTKRKMHAPHKGVNNTHAASAQRRPTKGGISQPSRCQSRKPPRQSATMSQEDNTNIIAEGDWAKISSMLGANTANCMAPDCASSDASKDPMWSNTPTNTNEMAKLHWQPCRFPSARADRHGGQERCQASPPASSGKARSSRGHFGVSPVASPCQDQRR